MIIGVDFDGTICEHTYPLVGAPVPHAIRVMKRFMGEGHDLILWTVRGGVELEIAKAYCNLRGIRFWGTNENPDQVAGQKAETGDGSGSHTWSCKAHMNVLIDDVALGCPLLAGGSVDWLEVEMIFEERGWL